MAAEFKKLTLSDLILNRDGSITFRLILAAFGIALRLFFRRIETVNAENLPKKAGLLFVLNHPNGLIDAALVFVSMPHRVSFLAKSTLFQMPVISFLLRTVEALPLYRKIDSGVDVSKNQKTFEACRELLKKGGSIAMFPEGISHNSPKLLPAKTGAARIALGAVSAGAAIDLQIVPVGLYYTSKTTFRSEALLHFGEPFTVMPVQMDADGEPPRDDVNRLTERIENELRDVTLNAETEAELHAANIAEQIFAAAEENENLGEKLHFLKNYIAETTAGNRSQNDTELYRRIQDYDKKLRKSGLEPAHLSLAQFSRAFVVKQAFLQTWPLLFLSPLAAVGTIIHFPAYQFCKLLSRIYAMHGADDVASTVKVLAGMLFVPLTWLVIALILWFFFGWEIALISIPVSFLCGYAALYTLEEIAELRGWTRAIILFLTKREKFLRLFIERRELQQKLREFD